VKKHVKLLHIILIIKVLVRYVSYVAIWVKYARVFVMQVETINPHDENQFPGISQLTEEQKVWKLPVGYQ